MTSANSILSQILAEYGRPEKVRLRDPEAATSLVRQLAAGGAQNLQIVTDFDFTLSKHHVNGKNCSPAADIIRQSPLMPDEFRARARARYDKLLPIELDPALSVQQKTPAVIASFEESFADLVQCGRLSNTILREMIANSDQNCDFQFRDNCDRTLSLLHDAGVPVLIFSAGFGDLVHGLLQKHGLDFANIEVVANFMEFGGAEELLIGFKEPLIHTFNKNESMLQNLQHFQELTHRKNIILLGDMIGDAGMVTGTPEGGVLKIGFLNHVDEDGQQLASLLEVFDIILLDDESMNFVNCLLKKIT